MAFGGKGEEEAIEEFCQEVCAIKSEGNFLVGKLRACAEGT